MSNESPTEPLRRILLVEDDLDQAHLVKFLLEDGGRYSVTLAQDGVRGTHLASDHRWDLVITDLNLPGVDGIKVMEASLGAHPETPVIATTGYTGPEYADQALDRGAAHVLIKPLQKDELLAQVDRIVRGAETVATADPDEYQEADQPNDVSARVLAVSVRPGDAEAGCAGALLRHRDYGDRVIVLTLTRGEETGDRRARKEAAKAAGRSLGVRFFVGNAGSEGNSIEDDVRSLVRGAIKEIRPDVVYTPTAHHADPTFRVVHEAVLETGGKGSTVLAYDPGDGSAEFRPRLFVAIDEFLEAKLEVLEAFDPDDGRHLEPGFAAVCSRFWSRHTAGAAAEAFELIRGRVPRSLDPS